MCYYYGGGGVHLDGFGAGQRGGGAARGGRGRRGRHGRVDTLQRGFKEEGCYGPPGVQRGGSPCQPASDSTNCVIFTKNFLNFLEKFIEHPPIRPLPSPYRDGWRDQARPNRWKWRGCEAAKDGDGRGVHLVSRWTPAGRDFYRYRRGDP